MVARPLTHMSPTPWYLALESQLISYTALVEAAVLERAVTAVEECEIDEREQENAASYAYAKGEHYNRTEDTLECAAEAVRDLIPAVERGES